VTGSVEGMGTSDEELQNTSAKEDETNTKGDGDSVASGETGSLKKSKKRKDGADMGSVKKKQKIIGTGTGVY
jgi:hypothetical protein